MRRIAFAVVVLAFVTAPVAEARSDAARLVARVAKEVERDKACQPRLSTQISFSNAAPSARLTAVLAPLRREQTAEEQAVAWPDFLGHRDIFRGSLRLLRDTAGNTYTLFAVGNLSALEPRSRRCRAKLRRRFARALAGRSRAFRERARAAFAETHRAWLGDGPEGVVLGARGGSGGATVERLTRTGLWSAYSETGRPTQARALLPDGVASVDVVFRGGASRSGTVRDNVVSFELDVPASLGLPKRQVWRAADGTVIRTVR